MISSSGPRGEKSISAHRMILTPWWATEVRRGTSQCGSISGKVYWGYIGVLVMCRWHVDYKTVPKKKDTWATWTRNWSICQPYLQSGRCSLCLKQAIKKSLLLCILTGTHAMWNVALMKFPVWSWSTRTNFINGGMCIITLTVLIASGHWAIAICHSQW